MSDPVVEQWIEDSARSYRSRSGEKNGPARGSIKPAWERPSTKPSESFGWKEQIWGEGRREAALPGSWGGNLAWPGHLTVWTDTGWVKVPVGKQGQEEDEEDFMEEEDGEGMANHVTCADDKVWKALCLGS